MKEKKTKTQKILLIEDNIADAELIREALTEVDGQYELIVADRLSSGIQIIKDRTIDVVFLDLGLPDSNGIDTLRQLKPIAPDVPVIVLTGFSQMDLATKAVSLGAQDCLTKGKIDGDILRRSIIYSIERKRAQDALMKSERRFAAFMLYLPAAAWIKDLQGKYVYANAEAERIFATPLHTLKGKSDFDIFPPETAQHFVENDQRVLAEGRLLQTTERLPQQNGLEHHSIVNKFIIPGPDGQPAFIAGVAFDITEQKRVEELLGRKKELSEALNRANILIHSTLDPDEILNQVVKETAKAAGADAGVIYLSEADFLTPRYIYGLPTLAGRRLTEKDIMYSAIAVKEGRTVLVNDISDRQAISDIVADEYGMKTILDAPLIVQEDVVGDFALYSRSPDIFTDQHVDFITDIAASVSLAVKNALLFREINAARASLQASEERFRAIYDNAAIGLEMLDFDGRYISGNGMVAHILGYSDEELQKRTFLEISHPEDLKRELPLLEQLKTQQIPNYSIEKRYIHKKGHYIWARVTSSIAHISSPYRISIIEDITDRKRTQEALAESEARLRSIASTALDAVILIDNSGDVAFWNDAAAKMFGYRSEEILGKYLHSYIMPERHVDAFRKGFEAFQRTGDGPFIGKIYEIEAKRKDGAEFPVELSLSSLKLKGVWNAVGIVRDISERKRAEEALITSEHQYRTLFNAIDEGFCIIAVLFDQNMKPVDYRFLEVNPSFEKQTGLIGAQGKRMRELVPKHEEHWFETYGKIALTGEPSRFENRAEQLNRWYNVYAFRIGRPEDRKVAVLFNDISEQKRNEEEIREMAHHDALTGLPNRRLFVDILNVEREQSNRHRKKMAVLFLDLDRFKEVNDTLGHAFGDQLLKEAASRLKSLVRKADTVARIGGDEFNIILADIARPEDTAEIARNIIESFQTPFRFNEHALNVTTSIGISIYPDDSEDIDALLKFADIAMYHAKELGRNRYRFYDHSINVKSLERMRLEGMLQRSLDMGEMVIYYQPLIEVRTRRIVCAEALTRWRHPDRGLLSPAEFIPAAEETGFINVLDEWSLKTVCRQGRAWLDAGNPPVCITVNLSARQFQDPELVKKVSSILEETGMPPDCLDIEITETTAMSDVGRSAAQLRELSQMGIHISIDDFGTGYSSLNHLKRLPIERLKIDRSFVQDIANDSDDRAIVQAVTAMAHNMKIKVVAEGVETAEQLQFLSDTGCDEMQGFLFSKPVPAEEFEALVTAGKKY